MYCSRKVRSSSRFRRAFRPLGRTTVATGTDATGSAGAPRLTRFCSLFADHTGCLGRERSGLRCGTGRQALRRHSSSLDDDLLASPTPWRPPCLLISVSASGNRRCDTLCNIVSINLAIRSGAR